MSLEIIRTVPLKTFKLSDMSFLFSPTVVIVCHGVYFKPRQDCLLFFSLLSLDSSTLFYIQSSVYSRRSFYNLYEQNFQAASRGACVSSSEHFHRSIFTYYHRSIFIEAFSPTIIGAFSLTIIGAFSPTIIVAYFPPLSLEHFL